ncbi:MAG TPA: YfcE family phosphodiesterase [Pirellulales bacterium]|nr:YfcE family phosphodiesterase [Pirellulales bacterium]
MRIGVLSDTHGQVRHTQNAVRMLESLEVELVLHCGDIGSAAVVELFASWPTHFVFGNVDDPSALGEAILAAKQICHERFGQLELVGRRIAFLHGDDVGLLNETATAGKWDLVCHGHTHVARQQRLGRTLVLNPGAVYRASPHTIACVELPQVEATVMEV